MEGQEYRAYRCFKSLFLNWKYIVNRYNIMDKYIQSVTQVHVPKLQTIRRGKPIQKEAGDVDPALVYMIYNDECHADRIFQVFFQ